MSELIRWEPFRDMLNMRRDMDRLFDNFFAPFTEKSWDTPTTWGLAVDVSENEDAYTVRASLPGVKPDDIEVTLTENVLTIKGTASSETETEGEKYHLRERRYGSFGRTLTLPAPLKQEAIEASHENGVLTLRLPKAEETKPKRISIKPTAERKVIEG
jgi:HSP20 family protein